MRGSGLHGACDAMSARRASIDKRLATLPARCPASLLAGSSAFIQAADAPGAGRRIAPPCGD
ncbi:hypothetical protein XarjCFBP7652_22255 [Xanthomonas arboricola]|nr:hypothetical protein XarjCFBP7652_22255 [Xanthomonas arboricola]